MPRRFLAVAAAERSATPARAQAMVRPIATESVKNSSVEAKPTAAASSCTPSSEM